LNRLDHAWSTTGTAWDINYTLDAWGNMTNRGPSSSGFTNNPAPDTFVNSVDTNNRLVSQMGYDAAGNVVADGNHTYVFDGENRVRSAAGVGYQYDAGCPRFALVFSRTWARRLWITLGIPIETCGSVFELPVPNPEHFYLKQLFLYPIPYHGGWPAHSLVLISFHTRNDKGWPILA